MIYFTAIYNAFNYAEGFIWMAVALSLPALFKPQTNQRKWGIGLASFGLVLFGISDLLEASIPSEIPVALLVYKIVCGAIILSGRYTYLGWNQFTTRDRFFLFGLFCLIVVAGIIAYRIVPSLMAELPPARPSAQCLVLPPGSHTESRKLGDQVEGRVLKRPCAFQSSCQAIWCDSDWKTVAHAWRGSRAGR